MRMWMVDPKKMCNQHLLGEHVECHMLLGSLEKKKTLDGFVEKGLIQPLSLEERHNRLVVEMKRRGMNHQSPLKVLKKDIKYLPENVLQARVNKSKSLRDLLGRCQKCREMNKQNMTG